MVAQEICFGDAEFKVKDVEELALYPTNITFAKYARAKCPVDILQRRIIEILGGMGQGWNDKESRVQRVNLLWMRL
jgi:hypothetical protein